MGILSNIIVTLAPVAVGVGIGYYISRKDSLISKSDDSGTPNEQLQGQEDAETSVKAPSQNPDSGSLQANTDSAGGNGCPPNREQPNSTPSATSTHAYREGNITVHNDINDSENDIEEDSEPTSYQNTNVDAVLIPAQCKPQHIEKHDAILLYAEEDRRLVKRIQQELMSNLGIDDLSVVLYEEFAPDVRSHFKTMEQLFCRCRFLFVVVTSNFREDSLTRYQHEIALTDSIRNPSRNERVVPVWAEAGAQNLLHELSVLKGIDFSGDEVNFQMFKSVFDHGRKNIHL